MIETLVSSLEQGVRGQNFIVKGAPSGQIRDLLLYTVYLFHGAAHRNHLKAQLLDS